VDFSEARDLFVNIFQILGLHCKITDDGLISEKQRGFFAKYAKLDRGLISEKQRGFFTKWRGISVGIYFSTDKSVDRVHASVDRPGALGPLWTDGGANRGRVSGHDGALTGARPPAAPVRQSSPAGAQQREERTGSLARASSGVERCQGGLATEVKNREAVALGEGATQAWREGKGSGGRCGDTRGWCSPFIGAGGGRRGVPGVTAG
jgi:hypothetical protein